MKKILLFLVCLLLTCAIYADNGFYIQNGVLLKCTQNIEYLKIPNNITRISEGVFNDLDKVKTIYIPASVTNFEYFPPNIERIEVDSKSKNYSSVDGILFDKEKSKLVKFPPFCKIKEYSIPNTVTLVKVASFMNLKYLQTLNIPYSVQAIDNVFLLPYELKAINVDKFNSHYSSVDGILFSKDKKTLIYYPANKEGYFYNIPDGTEKLEKYCFIGNLNLKEVNIPDSVQSIEEGALSFAQIKRLLIPKTVRYIGNQILAYTPIKSLTLEMNVQDDQVNFSDTWDGNINELEIYKIKTKDGTTEHNFKTGKVTFTNTAGEVTDITEEFNSYKDKQQVNTSNE